jgi:hypothetical protein
LNIPEIIFEKALPCSANISSCAFLLFVFLNTCASYRMLLYNLYEATIAVVLESTKMKSIVDVISILEFMSSSI